MSHSPTSNSSDTPSYSDLWVEQIRNKFVLHACGDLVPLKKEEVAVCRSMGIRFVKRQEIRPSQYSTYRLRRSIPRTAKWQVTDPDGNSFVILNLKMWILDHFPDLHQISAYQRAASHKKIRGYSFQIILDEDSHASDGR